MKKTFLIIVLMFVFVFTACGISNGNNSEKVSKESPVESSELSKEASSEIENSDKVSEDNSDVSDEVFEAPDDIVIDALNYEKDVIPAMEDWANDFLGRKHKIVIPKLNLNTKNANDLNSKIYDTASSAYQELINNNEGSRIHTIEYEFGVTNNIVGIHISRMGGVQHGGGWGEDYFYYYDVENDSEIDFEEYLQLIEMDIETLANLFIESEKYKTRLDYGNLNLSYGIQGVNIINAIVGDGFVVIEYDGVENLMDGDVIADRFEFDYIDDTSKENSKSQE